MFTWVLPLRVDKYNLWIYFIHKFFSYLWLCSSYNSNHIVGILQSLAHLASWVLNQLSKLHLTKCNNGQARGHGEVSSIIYGPHVHAHGKSPQSSPHNIVANQTHLLFWQPQLIGDHYMNPFNYFKNLRMSI